MIRLHRNGGVARIYLDRPSSLNALSPELLRELVIACDELSADDSIRVVVLEGTDGNFSAGADLPLFAVELPASPIEAADLGRIAVEAVAALPQITIAVLDGHCVGGGVVLAAVCDIRIAADRTQFRIPELEAGIPLAWGGMAHLVRLVGEAMAADLVLSCRPFSAEEALSAGFLSRVVASEDLASEAEELVQTIASRTRLSLQITKTQLQAIRDDRFDPASDAQALLGALSDPETAALLTYYVERLA